MFYAHFVLSKKGPLARIWLAAHWDKKLTKAQVFETNIESSVEGILQPKAKLALRTSGHLMLGVVRIYSRKAKYLLADCNEAFIKIKMAFRPGIVDLPEENREAAVATITLPEVFHDFDTAMTDMGEMDVQAQFNLNQSRAEEITMREDYGNISFTGDDGFGEMGFDEPELGRDGTGVEATLELFARDSRDKAGITLSDNFGDEADNLLGPSGVGNLFEPAGLFDDAPIEPPAPRPDTSISNIDLGAPGVSGVSTSKAATPRRLPPLGNQSDDDDDFFGDNGPPSMGGASSGPPSAPPSPGLPNAVNDLPDFPIEPVREPEINLPGPSGMGMGGSSDLDLPPDMDMDVPAAQDQTTLIHNEDETFALAPLDVNGLIGMDRGKTKRKRKLIVDEVKNISGEEMKSQLSDTSDIVATLDLAPPTKRLMHWKETGGVEKLFALPGRPLYGIIVAQLYQRHLTTKGVPNEDFGIDNEDDRLVLEPEGTKPEEIPVGEIKRITRKRKLDTGPPKQPVVAKEKETRTVPPLRLQLTRDENQQPIHTIVRASPSQPQPPLVIDTSYQQEQPPQHDVSYQPQPDLPPPQDLPLQVQPEVEQQQPSPVKVSMPVDVSANDYAPAPAPVDYPETPAAAAAAPLQPSDFFASPNKGGSVVDQTVHPADVSAVHVNQSRDASSIMMMAIQPQEDLFAPHSVAPQTPYRQEDDDEYACPPSVGPVEQRADDETDEQFEERVVNKRASHLLHIVQKLMQNKGGDLKMSEFMRNSNRKQVAQKFYSFLVLKKTQAVDLLQDGPFAEITIIPGPNINKAAV